MQEAIDIPAAVRRCLTCGDEFDPKKANQRYCRPEHRPAPTTLKISPEQRSALIALARQLL